MSRSRRARLLWPLLLLAACAAAGARLYDEWRRPPALDESAATVAPPASAAAPASAAEIALALPPPEQFAVIVERPLFAQSRRPPPPAPPEPEAATESAAPAEEPTAEAAPPAEEAPPTVDFTLIGIVTDGNERHALVQRQSDGSIVDVPEGGDVSGWFAVLIDPERAVFRQGGTEEELVLKFDAPVPPNYVPPPRPRVVPSTSAPATPAPPDDGSGNGTTPQ